MSRNEGTAHGRHYTEEENAEDSDRNYNQSKGRRHTEPDEDNKAGGHSDRWAAAGMDESAGRQHEMRDGDSKLGAHDHDDAQSEGRMQGQARKEGGHQTGRNQTNSR